MSNFDWIDYVRQKVATKSTTRTDMVVVYRTLLQQADLSATDFWAEVNQIILQRFVLSSIKRAAWKPGPMLSAVPS